MGRAEVAPRGPAPLPEGSSPPRGSHLSHKQLSARPVPSGSDRSAQISLTSPQPGCPQLGLELGISGLSSTTGQGENKEQLYRGLNHVLQKDRSPGTSDCDLIWKWVFADVIVRRFHDKVIQDFGWALNRMAGVLMRRSEDTDTEKGRGRWRQGPE